MPNLHRFAVVDGGATEQVVSGLERLDRFEREAARTRTVVVHDTFDWRVHLDGGRLEHVREAATGRGRRARPAALVWRDRETGEERGRWEVAQVPRFVWDLPPGPVTDRLAGVVEMRALLPLARVESSLTTLRLLDDEDKTVARVVVEEADLVGEPRRGLGVVVEVVPLRGYARHAERLASRLAGRDDLEPGGEDLIARALVTAGHAPGGYSSKLRLSLDPSSTALAAWAEVLRTLHATMAANLDGTVGDVDSEFLHDFRVAVRRTRSVLGEAKGVLPAGLLVRVRREFKWLGDITTPTRDFDVYLLTLPSFVDGLPPERRDDLDAFGTFLARHQKKAQRAMAGALTSDRFTELDRDWSAFLDDPEGAAATAGDRPPLADEPAPAVAARRIWKAYRRLVELGRSITDDSPPTDLHELRKDGKRLRYLLECFGSLFPTEQVDPLVKELKVLQDVLGEYQDCHVQIESLGELGQQMLDEGGTGAAALLAMGHLVDQIDHRQHEVRGQFAERFARFDAPTVRRRFRSTFHPRTGASDAVAAPASSDAVTPSTDGTGAATDEDGVLVGGAGTGATTPGSAGDGAGDGGGS